MNIYTTYRLLHRYHLEIGFVNHCHVVEASAETVRNISLVRKVRLEDVCRVGFDAVE